MGESPENKIQVIEHPDRAEIILPVKPAEAAFFGKTWEQRILAYLITPFVIGAIWLGGGIVYVLSTFYKQPLLWQAELSPGSKIIAALVNVFLIVLLLLGLALCIWFLNSLRSVFGSTQQKVLVTPGFILAVEQPNPLPLRRNPFSFDKLKFLVVSPARLDSLIEPQKLPENRWAYLLLYSTDKNACPRYQQISLSMTHATCATLAQALLIQIQRLSPANSALNQLHVLDLMYLAGSACDDDFAMSFNTLRIVEEPSQKVVHLAENKLSLWGQNANRMLSAPIWCFLGALVIFYIIPHLPPEFSDLKNLRVRGWIFAFVTGYGILLGLCAVLQGLVSDRLVINSVSLVRRTRQAFLRNTATVNRQNITTVRLRYSRGRRRFAWANLEAVLKDDESIHIASGGPVEMWSLAAWLRMELELPTERGTSSTEDDKIN